MNKNIVINHKTILVCTFFTEYSLALVIGTFHSYNISNACILLSARRFTSCGIHSTASPVLLLLLAWSCVLEMQSLTLQSSYREAFFFQEHAQINALKHET